MRRHAWMLVATSSFTLLPSLRAQDADAAMLTASQILQRVAGSYAGARSYRDAGLIDYAWSPHSGAEETADGVRREHIPFRTAFVRPASFLFDARGSEKGPHRRIIAWQSGDQVRIWEGVRGETIQLGSLGAALLGASAPSCDVSQDVAKLLMPLQVASAALTSDLAHAERIEDAVLDDVPCFRVHGTCMNSLQKPIDCILWIDQKSYLLRRTEKVMDSSWLGMHEVTTTTYEPEIDIDIGQGELRFDHPSEQEMHARHVEAAHTRAAGPPSLTEAMQLAIAGDDDAALIELDLLWNAPVTEEWEEQPFTDSMLLDCIGRQAAKHPATREHFSQVLDKLDAEVRGGDASMRVWSRWALLARALKLDDRIVQLYVERRTPAGTIRPYVDMHPIVVDTLVDVLVERKQLADAGRVFVDPVKSARWQYQSMQMTLAGLDEKTRASCVVADMRQSIRKGVGRMHALLLAADRKQDAEQVAQAMLGSDLSIEARRELISACLDLGVPCESIPDWIDEIHVLGGKTGDLDALINKAAEAKQTGDSH